MENKTIGVVIDLSCRHVKEGRLVDAVKRQLIAFVRETLCEEDGFYLYSPEFVDVEVLYRRGEQVGAISNYESDGSVFQVPPAVKLAQYVVGSSSQDDSKYVFVISDRMGARRRQIQTSFDACNRKDDLGCQLVLIGLGEGYEKCAEIRHVEETQLCDVMKEITNGQNLCCHADES